MWGDVSHHQLPPDSEEELRVVYGDGGGGLAAEAAAEAEEAAVRGGRASRLRYGYTQAGSMHRMQVPSPSAAQQQQQEQPRPASPAASVGRPGSGTQHPPLTLAQELQGVLDSLSQPPDPPQQAPQSLQLPAQQQSTEEEEPGAWRPRPRRSGPRRIAHTSPAVPASDLPPPAGSGPASGGRRWARAQAAAAAARSPALAGSGEAATEKAAGFDQGGDTFFSVDQDLMQAHAQRQQAATGRLPGRRAHQGRATQLGSPQAPAAGAGAQHTPLQPSQRANPLAALLGGGGGSSAAKPRAATTGGKLRGRHPIYGAPSAGTPAASQGSQLPQPAQPGSTHVRELLGLHTAPTTSPRQAAPRRHAPPLHSRFAIRDPAAATAAPGVGEDPQPALSAAGTTPAGLQQLTGEQPASVLRQPFLPRPQRDLIEDEVVEEDEEEAEEGPGQQRQGAAGGWPRGEHQGPLQGQQAPGLNWRQSAQRQGQQQAGQEEGDADAGWRELEQQAATDGYRTPGQPQRRSWLGEQQQQHQQQQQQQEQQERGLAEGTPALAGPGMAALSGTGGSDRGGLGRQLAGAHTGSAGRGEAGKGQSLQRQFIAQLQPVSSSAAAATMQQQRQRLAGAAGLYARMQAILAAEKAAQEASPAGGRSGEAGPRLTVLQKELEGSITKCLCRCDRAGEAALGAPEVLALLQSRTAQRVDTAPGSVIQLRQPWRVMPLTGSAVPAVLCFAAAMG
ncbi:hypothetical protein ABPG77_004932 [Micractinium sp. CCAP 211/92]